MVNNSIAECCISTWYPLFRKESLTATVLYIPNEVLKYLEHDAFVLPLEAANVVEDKSSEDYQPTFPEFSKQIQDVIDEYGTVFIKSNWSSPSDATWIAPTKTLKCETLEEIYLLLKSSDRIATDLQNIRNHSGSQNAQNQFQLEPCLVLKQWYDINPCTEFRCFVMDNELVGISQRDISQYHSYNESEKYNIQTDIRSLFQERIRDRYPLTNYSFDVIRFKKDKVKIVDFGQMDESVTKGTLFTYEELRDQIGNGPEFRFIAEEIGIQPKPPNHFCIPREINEFFQSFENTTMLDVIRREVEKQQNEREDSNTSEAQDV